MVESIFAALFWDPDPIAFRIPLLGHPIVWYGILFALGFLFGYLITCRVAAMTFAGTIRPSINWRKSAATYTDKLLFFTVVGTVVGARLGHVFFYEWPYYREFPGEILKIWHGGLASHGAALGVLLSLVAFQISSRIHISSHNQEGHPSHAPRLSFIELLDLVVLPTSLIAVFIRMGNFMNQEIVGTSSNLPWAVLFGHPAGASALPRHPVQLYEGLTYLLIFLLLYLVARLQAMRSSVKGDRKLTGLRSGLFFILVFGSRFFFEFVKERIGSLNSIEAYFSMGQLLSLPFIAVGVVLLILSLKVQLPSSSSGRRGSAPAK